MYWGPAAFTTHTEEGDQLYVTCNPVHQPCIPSLFQRFGCQPSVNATTWHVEQLCFGLFMA
jgi:hypothetical protein